MAESGLLPKLLQIVTPYSGTPMISTIIPSLFSFAMTVALWKYPNLPQTVFSVCMLSSYISYLSSFASFISLRLYYLELSSKSPYKSQLGVPGAIAGILLFSICIVAVAGFQHNSIQTVTAFLIFIGVISIYYITVARNYQRFSRQEKAIMLIAHVLKGILIIDF